MMTKDAVEQEIRAIGRRCRGPHRRSVAVCMKELVATVMRDPTGQIAREGIDDADAPTWLDADAIEVLRACKTTREVVVVLLDQEKKFAAKLIDHAARQPGCGQDVNDLILAAGQFDGEEHEVECPRCETTIKYTPANYEAEVEPGEA